MTITRPEIEPDRDLSSPTRNWKPILRMVSEDRISQVVFVLIVVSVGLIYSIALPYSYTQRFYFANWHYLDIRYIAYSISLAIGMAWVLTLQVYAMRNIFRTSSSSRQSRRSGPIGFLASIISFLPSLLCCSPIVPTLVSILPLSVATRLNTTGRITYFFATKENYILSGALILLIASGVWSLGKLARSQCINGECNSDELKFYESDVIDDRPHPIVETAFQGPLARKEG